MDSKLRVAAYCRVSTQQDEQINSLNSQRDYFARYISQHDGWEFVGVYYDEGISGTQTRNRAGFNRMLADAAKGKMDLILTKEVSRFARNTVDTLNCTRQLRQQGVGVFFTTDNLDTRQPDGELRLTIMAGIAQEESRKTSERVKWGQRRRMEAGVVFGRDLLGYTVKKGVLFVNEQEAWIVQRIFHKYTNEGKGVHRIASELTAEGIRPKRSRQWSDAIVLKILKNEKYVGDLCQKKTYTPDYLTHCRKTNDGSEEKVYLVNHHQAIIGRDLWERTQQELECRGKGRKVNNRYSNRYWCSGRLYCASCRKPYVSRTIRRKDGSCYQSWRCYAAAHSGSSKITADGRKSGCSNPSYNDVTLRVCMQYCLSRICADKETISNEICKEIVAIRGSAAKNSLERCAAAIDAMLHADGDNELLYRELLRKMVLYPDHSVDVYLQGLSSGIRLTVRTSGRRERYRAEVTDMDMVQQMDGAQEWL